MNTFDPDTHSYAVAGRPVPSVTQVLADLLPGWRASEWYLTRGRAVHACAALVAKGAEFEFDPAIAGQVAALRLFFGQVNPTVLAVEQRVFSDRWQYAGTLDLLIDMNGRRCVVDFKASMNKSVPYQVAAYGLALKPAVGSGVAVVIADDGTYRLSEVYDLKRYTQGWLALLTAYGIRRQCGIKQEGETA